MAVWWDYISRRRRARDMEGTLMSNVCLISHRSYNVEKLAVPGSSNLNLTFSGTQQNVFLLKRRKKNVFHFVLLN